MWIISKKTFDKQNKKMYYYIGHLENLEKTKVAKKHHEWFIWPKDNSTNESIARMAHGGDNRFEEGTLTDALCEDGKRRNLWRITEDDAWFFWRSRTDLKFQIFNRLGAGKIRNVTFLFRRDRRSPKKKGTKNAKA